MPRRKLRSLYGPRVPSREWEARRWTYLHPTLFMGLAALLLLISVVTPYWSMTLHAPQYPGGLQMKAYLTHLTGDVREIDGLNHYIGMRPLGEAAKIERSLSIAGIIVLVLLIAGAIQMHTRWAALLSLPAILFPLIFLLDLYFWLSHFGQNLDPRAPLSSSIDPFVPPVLGTGHVGQFRTVALPDIGLILAALASLLILVGLWFHRRAYQPLVEEDDQIAPPRVAGRGNARTSPRRVSRAIVLAVGLAGVWPLVGGMLAAETMFDLERAMAHAEPGDRILVPPGVYHGPVRITRPLELVAGGEAAGEVVIDAGGSGDGIQVLAPDVRIEGFYIRATGESLDQENAGINVEAPGAVITGNCLRDVLFGIYLKNAPHARVVDNDIRGKKIDIALRGDALRLWYSDSVRVVGNRIQESRDVVVWFSRGVYVAENHITDGRYGLHFMYCDDNIVVRNRIERNSVGAFLMYSANLSLEANLLHANRGPSGYGVGLKDLDGVEARDNLILGNRVGIYLDNSPGDIDVRNHFLDNTLAFNDIGVAFLPSVRRNAFWNNAFVENLQQVAVRGGGRLAGNAFTVAGVGNYWSDYAGYDLDDDCSGDLPYESVSLFEDLMDRHKRLRIFRFSPVEQAIRLAARSLPMIRPQPRFTDTAPRLAVPQTAAPRPARSARWPLGCLGLGLLVGGTAIMSTQRLRRSQRFRLPEPVPDVPPRASGGRSDAVLRMRNVSADYGRMRALQGLDLTLRGGEAVALWGDNGAGKTTAIRCLLGLVRFGGAITVAGFDAARQGTQARRLIGYVPQELALYEEMTTTETIVFFARIRTQPPLPDACGLASILREVGLEAKSDQRVGSLSGGMKQRLALAVALLGEPSILVLDEVTSNLDAPVRKEFLALLRRLKARGLTLLFTSHRWDEVEALADRVVTLDAGRVVSCEPAGRSLASRPEVS